MTKRVDPTVITQLENKLTVVVGSGYFLSAATLVLGLILTGGDDGLRREHVVEGLAIASLALMVGLLIWLCGFLARHVIRQIESEGI